MRTATPSECRICAIASGQHALDQVDRPWLVDDRYVAFTSIGALVEGWSLVAPRVHSLNLLEEYVDTAFVNFVREAISVVESAYGSAVIFEHGGQREGSATNCGTSHAHLHIVPVKFSVQQAAIAFDEELEWLQCSSKNIKEIVGKQEYLFVADRYDGGDTHGNVCILTDGQSQFFRRVIAEKLGRGAEFNYRTHPHLLTAEAASNTLRLLTSSLKAA